MIIMVPMLRHLPFHPYARVVAWDLATFILPVNYVLVNLCAYYLIRPLLLQLNRADVLGSLLCQNGLSEARCADRPALRRVIDDIINTDFTRKFFVTIWICVVVAMNIAAVYTVLRLEALAKEARRRHRAEGRLQRAQGWQQRVRVAGQRLRPQ